MITGLYGIGRFQGAALMALICLVCLLICTGIGFCFRCNRSPDGRKRFLVSLAAVAVICDVLMIMMLFPNGEYLNRGIGAASGMLLYPAVLCMTTAVVTAWNQDEV